MAIGGSTNVALHIPAIAYEADINISIDTLDDLSRSTPHIASIYPAGTANINDFHEAGGIPAVMKEIAPLLDLSVLTVTGKALGDNIYGAQRKNNEVIRALSNPFHKEGGLAILHGNLAPNGAVTKPVAIHESMWIFTGKARVFDSEEEANEAIIRGSIKDGDVIVIRYEGPKGGPGMREMARALKLLYGLDLALKTAVITDGRFSGTNNGCFVGHISPEADEGGPLAIVRDGDLITIDIPNRNLHLHVEEKQIEQRLQSWIKPGRPIKRGYLALYSKLAGSADSGAVIRHHE